MGVTSTAARTAMNCPHRQRDLIWRGRTLPAKGVRKPGRRFPQKEGELAEARDCGASSLHLNALSYVWQISSCDPTAELLAHFDSYDELFSRMEKPGRLMSRIANPSS